MYYHIQIITKDNTEIADFDIENLANLENDYLIPYLTKTVFQLDNYLINPNEIKRILVTESTEKSSECVNISYSSLPVSESREIPPGECVFDNETFSKDITQELTQKLKSNLSDQLSTETPSLIELSNRIDSQQSQLTNLISLSITLKKLIDEKVETKLKVYRYTLIGLLLFYYGIIIYLIYKLGWDCMEPVFYLLGIGVPILGIVILLIKEKTVNPLSFIINLIKKKRAKIKAKIYQKYELTENIDNSIFK